MARPPTERPHPARAATEAVVAIDAAAMDDDLLVALQRLGRLMASRRVAVRLARAAECDVSQQGVQLLRALARDGQLPVAGLAAAAHMDIAAVSRQLRSLEERGLVERAEDRRDRRVVLVSLSGRGAAAARRLREVGVRHLSDALAAWSHDDRAQLAHLLTRLTDDLRSTGFEPPEPGGVR